MPKKHWAIATKEENEVLKKEKEELEKRIAELSKGFDMTSVNLEESRGEQSLDDRKEEVTIYYGSAGKNLQGQEQYIVKKLPKNEAFQELVLHYQGKKNKIVPKPGSDNPGRNMATCYCRLIKTATGTNTKLTAVQEMPMWLAATRALEGKLVELITKEEYERYHREKTELENKWKQDIYIEKRKELMEKLAQTL